MVSRKYQCIFVHIPKTAGQSIESFFLKLHGLTWEERAPLLLRQNEDPTRGPERLAHLTACEYLEFAHVSIEEFQEYFKFAFVRNPWSRLVSEYRYRSIYHKLNFKEFLTRGLPQRCKFSDLYRHIQPQCEFVFDENGKPLVDFVGRFEDLQRDFDTVCARLSIQSSVLPVRNHSPKKVASSWRGINWLLSKADPQAPEHYSSYYDQEMKELVGEMYAEDIHAFGYSFHRQ